MRSRGKYCREWWYAVEVDSARLFRLGERLEAGAPLGRSCSRDTVVCVEEPGEIVQIQYDIVDQCLIVVLASAEDTGQADAYPIGA